jgi:Domain of unknown function (DUF4082)
VPSAGVMASAVHIGLCTDVLQEPFDNFLAWSVSGTPTIVAGRTGTAAQTSGSTNRCTYLIAAPAAQSDTLTIGFAFRKIDANATSRTIFELCDAADSVTYNTLKVEADGALGIYRGGTGNIATSAAGLIVANTWYYLELQIKLHNTAGTVTVRSNGVNVITFTGNTSQVADGIPYGGVRLANRVGSTTHQFDDLYLSTGPGCAFKGDIIVPSAAVLVEPFNNLDAWTNSGGTIVAGRTGTAVEFAGNANNARYTIPAASESDTLTIGFAYRATVVTAAIRRILSLWSDAAATEHIRLDWNPNDGRLSFQRVLTALATSAAGALPNDNTWRYIEAQIRLHDSAGFGIVRVNGTEVINASSLDTKQGGTKTTFDTLRLSVVLTSNTALYDDMYLTMGAGAVFKGDITIPSGLPSHVWPDASVPTTYSETAAFEIGTCIQPATGATIHGVRIWNPGLGARSGRSAKLWEMPSASFSGPPTMVREVTLPSQMTTGWSEHLFPTPYTATATKYLLASYDVGGIGVNDWGYVSNGLAIAKPSADGKVTFAASGGCYTTTPDGSPNVFFVSEFWAIDVLYM